MGWRRDDHLGAAIRMGHSRRGVRGVDFGYVYKSGKRLKSRGIRFHVANKVPLSELDANQIFPDQIGPYRCDVLEVKYTLHKNQRSSCDPLQPGISIGNTVRGSTGTMGMVVRDKQSGGRGILSNWHVLCGSLEATVGDSISQPGPLHLGSGPVRAVAALERWIRLDLGSDAALALLEPNIATSAALFETNFVITGVENPRLGTKVVKFGSTSGFTHGMVDGIGGTYEVDYSVFGDQKRWIDGVRIVVDPDTPENEISLAGDSGSVWINPKTGNAVALHFAGEDGLGPTAEYALAQPMPHLFQHLDIDIA